MIHSKVGEKMKLKILYVVFIILLILSTTCASYASVTDPITDPNYYRPNSNVNNEKVATIGRNLVAGIRNIGVVIAVVGLMIIGFRYMFASVEEKANYKETMIPYIIGMVMLFAITTILQIIYDFITKMG